MRLIPRTKRAEDPAVDPENPAQGRRKTKRTRIASRISISSEAEVPRWFGTEILDHSTSSVDLSSAAAGSLISSITTRATKSGSSRTSRSGRIANFAGSFASRVRLAPRILSATCRTGSVRLSPSAIA